MNPVRVFLGTLKVGDRFIFPDDYKKRIVSEIISKRGYITEYIKNKRKYKSFKYYKEVIILNVGCKEGKAKPSE